MRFFALAFVFSALFVTSCTSSDIRPFDETTEFISFETSPGPFCGKCNTTKLKVSYTGLAVIEQGYWRGDYDDWQVERKKVQVSAEALKNFQQHLEPFRPSGELYLDDTPPCDSFWTDNPEVTIVWQDAQAYSLLRYNFGCDREKRSDLAEALKEAPKLLEIPNMNIPEHGW